MESPVDQIAGRGLTFVTTGGDGEASALDDAANAGLSHETSHTLAADPHALLEEPFSHPGHAIGLAGIPLNMADALGHHCIGDTSLRRGTHSPCITPTGRDTEHTANGSHREVGLVRHHQSEDFADVALLRQENQAVAFARISRSHLNLA